MVLHGVVWHCKPMNEIRSGEALARDEHEARDPSALCELAASPDSPDELLAKLAGNVREEVRSCVGANPAASALVLEALMGDASEDVRWNAGETLYWLAREGLL